MNPNRLLNVFAPTEALASEAAEIAEIQVGCVKYERALRAVSHKKCFVSDACRRWVGTQYFERSYA